MIQSEPWTGTGLGTFEFIFPFIKMKAQPLVKGYPISRHFIPKVIG